MRFRDLLPEIENRKIEKLKEWRARYSKEEYPKKVMINVFYELFTLEKMWPTIESSFSGQQKHTQFPDAVNSLIDYKRQVQTSTIQQVLTQYISEDREAAGTKFSDYNDTINKAQSGGNSEVVEIEYCYWYFGTYCEAVIYWAGCGLMGLDKHAAFVDLTGGDIGGLKMDTLGETMGFLSNVLTVGVGSQFKDADGKPVNPISNQDIKYYPENFNILPHLWNKTSNSNSSGGCYIATAVYGSYCHSNVIELRKFRDVYLQSFSMGRKFISQYYKYSPALVKKMGDNKIVKRFIKICLNLLIFIIKEK